MKKAIYKIENKINHKIYIGESSDPKRRWQEHIGNNTQYVSLIHRALQKYGANNFTFEIIGWFEDWSEKEKYYIQFYKSLAPYGYNIHEGGGDPPHYSGENNNLAKISNEVALKVQEQAMDWTIPRKQIVKDNKITFDIFRHINDGTSWHRDDLEYPLRPGEREINDIKAKKVIDLLLNTTLSQKEIAKEVGWARSAITMINLGKNHHDDNLQYPLRK